ncbi:expressed hypothetical protein [Trichoplax adhaerens]|uniref:G-protein coupled receptors family 1 profile domain-containing protein n=1 Tax=Trichoplax adhaerens TaxID=10228 RepID=B3S7C3_TRIAD|nr:expressed hypothetical protein [Trichoplax adhaerens]EDV21542.1 expressed hypothetical protein [Trichoplax adhaerens]|eukprot:XP_002116142.1 expressed hypothetical protein [Trichoplax adhaerens]
MKKDFLDKLNLINDLKLAGNEWNADIKEMAAITNLKLDVSENPITLDTLMKDLSDLVGPFLVGIHLNNCNISSIPQKAFAFDSLRILSLDGNSICEFDMVDISNKDENILTDLSLSNNKLEKIYSSLSIRYGNLKKLNISGNIIEELCYQAIAKLFPNVREIDASRNKISTLQERCFRGLSSLQKLDLRKNWLGEVSRESFYGPSKLVEILTNRPYFCCIIPAKILSCKPSMISDTLSSCQHLLAHISLQFFIWLVGILAFLGNIFVIVRNLRIIRAKKKNKADKVNLFLINNLAISDFIMSIYLFIIGFANLVYSNQGLYGIRSEKWLRHPLCAVSCTLMTTSSIVSVFLMVVISIDRFITIVYGLEGKKLSRFYSRLIIGIIWLGGFTFALIPSLFSINQPGNKRLYTFNSMCMPSNYENPDYRVWMIAYIVSTIIAWIITCSLYIRLFIYIRDTGKAVTQATNRKAKARKDKMIALRLFIILITDLISWVPYYIVNFAGFASSDGVDVITLQFIGIFALPINSALNPYLYTLTSAAVIKGLFIRPATGATYTIRKKRTTKRRKQIKLEKNMDDLDHHHEKSNADKECSNTQRTFTF